MDFDAILNKLVEESKLSREEVLHLIDEKKNELSGLVSDVGAAHIVANELGIQTLPPITAFFRIEDLRPGITNADLTLRIITTYGIREFTNSKTGGIGKVANILVGDETGICRLVLWGSHAEETRELARDDIIGVKNAYVKADRSGQPEVHCGNRSKLRRINPETETEMPERMKSLPHAETIIAERQKPQQRQQQSTTASANSGQTRTAVVETKKISELAKDGEVARLKATVVKVMPRSPFYNVCPSCGKSAPGSVCPEHGRVESHKALIINAVLDDGTGIIRAVFFREAAEKLLGKKLDEALKETAGDAVSEAALLSSEKLQNLGAELMFTGRAKRNEMFDRLEFVVSDVNELNVEGEIKRLIEKLGQK